MRKIAIAFAAFGMALAPVLNAAPAAADDDDDGRNPTGLQRITYLSGKGVDSGSCQITAPCRTLTYALSQTLQTGGRIYVIDTWVSPDENVTITGAVSIYGGSHGASFGAKTGTALTINAGSRQSVALHNLEIRGSGTATNGIVFNSGYNLLLTDTEVTNFSNIGVTFSPNTSGFFCKLTIEENSAIHGNSNGDILLRPVGSTTLFAYIKDAWIYGSTGFGLSIDTTAGAGQVLAEISNSMIFNLGVVGISVLAPTIAGNVLVSETNISDGFNDGVFANGANALILLDHSTIIHSGVAVDKANGGTVVSYGNNGINLNTNNNYGALTPQSLH